MNNPDFKDRYFSDANEEYKVASFREETVPKLEKKRTLYQELVSLPNSTDTAPAKNLGKSLVGHFTSPENMQLSLFEQISSKKMFI